MCYFVVKSVLVDGLALYGAGASASSIYKDTPTQTAKVSPKYKYCFIFLAHSPGTMYILSLWKMWYGCH